MTRTETTVIDMTIPADGKPVESLDSYARRLRDRIEAAADIAAEIRQIKADAKNDGYNVSILSQAVKEMLRGPEYQADRLTAEAELDAVRRALGLPTSLEEAHARVRTEVEESLQ